jgi:feruloyl esterase
MWKKKSTVDLACRPQQSLARHRYGMAIVVAVSLNAGSQAIAAGPGDCAALIGNASPVGVIRNTTITSATYVTSAGGNYCEVAATVAPQHDVLVRLPDKWLGRYVELGGGGFDGRIPNLSGAFATSGKDPVTNGFVVAGDNGGHRGSQYPGVSFADDRGLTLSYASAKIYDTNLVAKVLIQAYYGQAARYRYFTGCSNGGKNASVAAANFADYFDGIIGGDGVWGHADDDVGGSDMTGLTSKWSQSVQVGALAPAKGAALYNATVQACDGLDGLKDGLVGNVHACPFMRIAESLRCQGADTGSCLTESDMAKVRVHTSPLVLEHRVVGAPWAGTANLADVGGSGLPSGFLAMAFRSATPIDPMTYDIATQFSEVKAQLDGVYSMTGNLGGVLKYLGSGKKLFLYHGWEDTTVPSYVSINFIAAVQRSDPEAGRNSRLYMAPGVAHCGGSVGADSLDLLTVMSTWVERHIEPGSAGNPVIAWRQASSTSPADISGAQFSRPLCPYPEYPQYSGSGDPNQAASFVCRLGPSGPMSGSQ